MRLLALLAWSTPLAFTLSGCTRDNPAFDDCDNPDRCLADDSGTGDGDPGDGDPGDGDGDPGDGDGDPGDGDGAPGDGDGDSGDGDGDNPNMLPACPDMTTLKLPVVKDTFLVSHPEQGGVCIVGWNFDTEEPKLAESQLPCKELTFGDASIHWICSGDSCTSVWLGRFNVGGYADQSPKVISAHVDFWSTIQSAQGSLVTAHTLMVDHSVFGGCNDWNPGSGWGEPAVECQTTWKYSAYPNLWSVEEVLGNGTALGSTQTPPGELLEHNVIVPINKEVANGWLVNDPLHLGLVLQSTAAFAPQFMVMARESEKPPQLVLEVCSDSE